MYSYVSNTNSRWIWSHQSCCLIKSEASTQSEESSIPVTPVPKKLQRLIIPLTKDKQNVYTAIMAFVNVIIYTVAIPHIVTRCCTGKPSLPNMKLLNTRLELMDILMTAMKIILGLPSRWNLSLGQYMIKVRLMSKRELRCRIGLYKGYDNPPLHKLWVPSSY